MQTRICFTSIDFDMLVYPTNFDVYFDFYFGYQVSGSILRVRGTMILDFLLVNQQGSMP